VRRPSGGAGALIAIRPRVVTTSGRTYDRRAGRASGAAPRRSTASTTARNASTTNPLEIDDRSATKIRPLAMLDALCAKLAELDDPRHRANLATVRDHVAAELDGRDVARVMATMVDEPQFHWYGYGHGDVGPKGKAAVESHYRRFLGDRCNLHQHDFRRIVVDHRHVVLEGPMHIVFPGTALAGRGIHVDDPASSYLFTYDVCAIFHFDESGRCTGEDSYGDGAPSAGRITKLDPADVPEPIEL
jgi:hypothetical protein